ncbi:hypothetical protein VKT23_017697 [Stygiomarasmius scandens]|uniref:Uncharacterized protein n=1 Tax=Marasmiellus scandens TaxID=2682957 RepID=A0ABR1IRD6_9AGAR
MASTITASNCRILSSPFGSRSDTYPDVRSTLLISAALYEKAGISRGGQVKSDRECKTRDWLKGTGMICEDIYTKHFFLATDFRSHLERQTSNWSPPASLNTTRFQDLFINCVRDNAETNQGLGEVF